MIRFTAGILFLVYLNAPAVAVRMHGAPFLLAAAVPLGLALPVAYRVLLRGEPLRFAAPLIAAVAMMLVQAISALNAIRPQESMDTLVTWLVEGVVVGLLVANAVRTRSELEAALDAIVAAGAVMGAIALAQQVLGAADHPFLGFGQLDSEITDTAGSTRYRLAGPIGETNRFAQIMTVLIPIAGARVATSRGARRAAHALALFLIAGGVAFTFSRGAIVGLALSAPFAVSFRLVGVRHLMLAGVATFCLLVAMPHYAERVLSIGEVAMQGLGLRAGGLRNTDGAARGRMTEMMSAALVFAENPILGAGPGLAPLYYDENAGVVGGKVRQGTRRSHNLYLELAAETGVIGLSAFALVIGLAFRDLDAARRRFAVSDRALWSFAVGLEVALIVSLTTSLFLHAAYIRYFWLLLGLSISASAQEGAPALVRLLARMLRETASRIRADA